jgi:tetratricopeptide (TPR) repeat protein
MMRLLFVVAATGWAALLWAGAGRADEVIGTLIYYDHARNKPETINNAVIEKETPAKVVYRLGAGKSKEVSSADVLDITYEKSAGAANLPTYRRALREEGYMQDPTLEAAAKQKHFDEALAAYKDLQENAKDAPPAVLRQLRFAVARLRAQRAEDDPAQADAAVQALSNFLKNHADGWQVGQAGRLLGKLQEARGDLAGAQKTYEKLAALDDLPKQGREEAELLLARLLIRTGKAAEAEAKLEKMARGLSQSDPEATKVQVYLAQAQVATGKRDQAEKKLKELVAANLDPAVKGLVYNALGDINRENKQPEQAFWDYLWVDVVYNQDKQEQAKALYWLSKLFVEVKNDPARAQECRKQLLEGKDFLGTDYQKLAAKDKGE